MTLHNLKLVIIQLQESCTDAKSQSAKLRKENTRLKNEACKHEKFWHALWARQKGHDPCPDDFSQIPYPSPGLSSTLSSCMYFRPLFILNYFHFCYPTSFRFRLILSEEHELWFHSISSGCNKLLIFEI